MPRPIIAALARAARHDIERAAQALHSAIRPRIHVFLATSDIHLQHKLRISRQQCLEQAADSVRLARTFCDDVEFSPEDATRTDQEFLFQVLAAVIQAGATTLNIPDTVGYTVPAEFGDLIRSIRERVPGCSLLVPPTVLEELAHLSTDGKDDERKAARSFLRKHRRWRFELVNYVPLGTAFVQRIAEQLRKAELLPVEEVNDCFILAETAALMCSILLTSDSHLRGVDYQRLSFELTAFDLPAPVIATPREIVRKFFR